MNIYLGVGDKKNVFEKLRCTFTNSVLRLLDIILYMHSLNNAQDANSVHQIG